MAKHTKCSSTGSQHDQSFSTRFSGIKFRDRLKSQRSLSLDRDQLIFYKQLNGHTIDGNETQITNGNKTWERQRVHFKGNKIPTSRGFGDGQKKNVAVLSE